MFTVPGIYLNMSTSRGPLQLAPLFLSKAALDASLAALRSRGPPTELRTLRRLESVQQLEARMALGACRLMGVPPPGQSCSMQHRTGEIQSSCVGKSNIHEGLSHGS